MVGFIGLYLVVFF